MTQIAYTSRVCTDQTEIDRFLSEQRVGVLGLAGAEYPYTVPVNYLWHDGAIYFHSMGSGKKIDLLRAGSLASFTVFAEYGTATDPVPCHADTAYTSVMIYGRAEELSDPTQARDVLRGLVEKLMPGYYRNPVTTSTVERYRSDLDKNPVAVFRITATQLTAKENRVEKADLFTPANND